MALAAILDTVEELPDALKSEYVEKDGKFYLDLKDDIKTHPKVAVLQRTMENVKQEKKDLQAKLDELEEQVSKLPDDYSLEEWDRLKTLEGSNPDDPDDRKKRADERLAQVREQLESQIAALKQTIVNKDAEHETKMAAVNAARARERVDLALNTAMDEANISPNFRKAVTSLHRDTVQHEIGEDESIRIFVPGDLGDMTVADYLTNWAKSDEGKPFVSVPTGPGGGGSKSQHHYQGDNPFTPGAWNKSKQAQMKDNPKAEQWAKAAGFPNLKSALKATRPLKQQQSAA